MDDQKHRAISILGKVMTERECSICLQNHKEHKEGEERLIVLLLLQPKNKKVPNNTSRFRLSKTRWLFLKCIVKLWGSLQEDVAYGGYMGIWEAPEHKLLMAEKAPQGSACLCYSYSLPQTSLSGHILWQHTLVRSCISALIFIIAS